MIYSKHTIYLNLFNFVAKRKILMSCIMKLIHRCNKMTFLMNTQQTIRYWLFEENLANYAQLALSYIWSPNRSHRSFVLVTAVINILCVIAFLFYAIAEKYQIVNSPLYGNPRFSLSDGSLLETFGYFLEIFSVFMFIAIGYAHKQYYWFAWALIFFVIFIDDSQHLHEYVRNYLVSEHGATRVSGEIAGYALLGCPILLLWVTGLHFCPPIPKQQQSYLLFSVYFGMLLAFGIGQPPFWSPCVECSFSNDMGMNKGAGA